MLLNNACNVFQKILINIICIVFVLLLVIFSGFTFKASAQTNNSNISPNVAGAATLGVARMIEVKEKNIKDGTVLSSSEKGAVVSTIPYDPQVLGIVSSDAAIVFSTGVKNSVPVISTGTVYILVSSKDGAIKKGDLLTTSTIPGIAVKAIKNGYVLGTALEDYSNSDAKKTEKIALELNLHYFNGKPTFAGSLTDIFKIALLATKDSPTALFKYIVAAGVVLGSFVLGFLSFGRTAAKGVEALGRNPAASKTIHLGIIFNVTIVVFIILTGLAVAFLILRL